MSNIHNFMVKKVIVKKVKLCSKVCDNHVQMASCGGISPIIAPSFQECKCYFDILHNLKLKILEYQPVAHIHAKWEQGNGHFGHHTGVFIFYKGVIATDINDRTEHRASIYSSR